MIFLYRNIWALIPVKETDKAKSRLGSAVPPHLRQGFALAMLEDVLAAVSTARGLAGVIVVTLDPSATSLARKYSARVMTEGATEGHTGAVRAAAKILSTEKKPGFLQMPLDIPTVSKEEITILLSQHRDGPGFTVAPSSDDYGSNGVLVTPPDLMPLTFGDDSFFPHLKVAQEHGIQPTVVRLPGFGLDIDRPDDFYKFAELRSKTRAQAYIERHGLMPSPTGATCKA
jgi:2-phospho-L-lactate guanylyltransferase